MSCQQCGTHYDLLDGNGFSPFPFVFLIMAQHYLVPVRTLAKNFPTSWFGPHLFCHHLHYFCVLFSLYIEAKNEMWKSGIVAHTCCGRQRLHSDFQSSLYWSDSNNKNESCFRACNNYVTLLHEAVLFSLTCHVCLS